MSIATIPQRIRGLRRLPQVLRVLLKYGFGHIVHQIGVDTLLHRVRGTVFGEAEGHAALATLPTPARIRLALQELGPTFIKLGQVLATRPDLVPLALVEELRKLQDKVEPFDQAGIRALVEQELGRPLEAVFQSFEERPLAAASIAQVHRAVLKDGAKVVLKVQRPNLDQVIEDDLAVLEWLAEVAEANIPELRRYSPVAMVSEFRRTLTKEIDFEVEAYHIRRFAKNFADDPDVHVPRVYEELSTSRLLCEEFIEGVPLSDKSLRARADADMGKIARTGVRIMIKQALVDGFFHGDPHPGNLFWLPGNRLCLIDYGMMGSLDQERIDDLLAFLVAILTRDPGRMIKLFQRLELIDDETDVRALKRDVAELIGRYDDVALEDVDVGRFLGEVFSVVQRHEVVVPADLLMVGKALATVEGVGREIYPQLNALEELRPVVLSVYARRLADPAFHTRRLRRGIDEALQLLENGPRDLRLALAKLRKGELTARVDLADYERVSRPQAQATNRLALAILTAAWVMTSAFLFTQRTQPELALWVGDFPLNATLGVVGLLMAGLFGGLLTFGFLRSGAF